MGYKRYGSSDSAPNFNDDNNGEAVSDGILKNDSKKEIYFGIAKPKKSNNFRNLQNSDFTKGLQSDTVGCTATLTSISNKLTIGQIRYNLSANTTGVIRNIIFKYNNIDLFHITQQSKIDDNIYIYLRLFNYQYDICIVSKSTDYIGFADVSIPDYAKEIILNGVRGNNLYFHVSNNKEDVINSINNKSITSLISSGVLTYVSGRNFNNNEYNLTKAPIKMVSSYTYNSSLNINLEEVKDDSIMYIFGGDSDATKGGQCDLNYTNKTIDWTNIVDNDNPESIGVYKYTKKTTYDIIIYSINSTSVTSEIGYKQYIFNMENNVGDGFTDSSPSKYMNLQFKKEPSVSNNTCSYLLWEKSNTLLYDSFKPETISNLKTKYNLKSKTNAADINYFYGKYILNVTGNTICKKGKSSRYDWMSSLVNYIFELKDGETEFKKKSDITSIGAFTIEV